jgi:hypothetical protein
MHHVAADEISETYNHSKKYIDDPTRRHVGVTIPAHICHARYV